MDSLASITRDMSTQAALDAAEATSLIGNNTNLFGGSGLSDTQSPDMMMTMMPEQQEEKEEEEVPCSQESFAEEDVGVDFGHAGLWRDFVVDSEGPLPLDGLEMRNALETPIRPLQRPETPTPATSYSQVHNPFAKHPRTSVLATSQLFQATPMLPLSGRRRRTVSPTSSRPSPIMFRDFASPGLVAATSPIERWPPAPTSPVIILSPRLHPSSPTGDPPPSPGETIPESPQYVGRRPMSSSDRSEHDRPVKRRRRHEAGRSCNEVE